MKDVSSPGRRKQTRFSGRAASVVSPKTDRRIFWILVAGLLAVLLTVAGLIIPFVAEQRSSDRQAAVTTGALALDFTAPIARGGEFRLSDLRDHSVLLAFLNVQAEPGGAPAEEPSRAQVVLLQSLERQYRLKDLRVVIIDASAIDMQRPANHDQLINYTYSWGLDAIPVLADDGTLAQRYGVHQTPTTFLIHPNGRVEQRWDGLVAITDLASALRGLLGRPTLAPSP